MIKQAVPQGNPRLTSGTFLLVPLDIVQQHASLRKLSPSVLVETIDLELLPLMELLKVLVCPIEPLSVGKTFTPGISKFSP